MFTGGIDTMMAQEQAAGDGLGAKLRALSVVSGFGHLPAGLRRLCATRMADGHALHAQDPLRDWRTDWRAEAADELADAVNYAALGGERSWRVQLLVALLGVCWRLLAGRILCANLEHPGGPEGPSGEAASGQRGSTDGSGGAATAVPGGGSGGVVSVTVSARSGRITVASNIMGLRGSSCGHSSRPFRVGFRGGFGFGSGRLLWGSHLNDTTGAGRVKRDLGGMVKTGARQLTFGTFRTCGTCLSRVGAARGASICESLAEDLPRARGGHRSALEATGDV